MAIKIASWNVESRLSGYMPRGRGSADHVLEGIETLDADIIVLPEAYLEQTAERVDERLKSLGFEWRDCLYSRNERDWSKEFMGKAPSLRVLSRLEMRDVRIGEQQRLVAFTVRDPKTRVDIRIFAVHLDDRNETLRESQVEALLPLLKETGLPTVVVGDFNAMWPKGRAQLLRSSVMRLIAKCIPHAGLRYTAIRLTEMAAGRVLGRFAEVGLRDVDPRHRSTTTPKMRDTLFLPSIRLVQIDHILVSEEVEVNGFKISADHGSDHRSIRATITTK